MGTKNAKLQRANDFSRWVATRLVTEMIVGTVRNELPRATAITVEADDAGIWDDVVEDRIDAEGNNSRHFHQVKSGGEFGLDSNDIVVLFEDARRHDGKFTLWVTAPCENKDLPLSVLWTLCDLCEHHLPTASSLTKEQRSWIAKLATKLTDSEAGVLARLGRIKIERFENHERLRKSARATLGEAGLPQDVAEHIQARLGDFVRHGNTRLSFDWLTRNLDLLDEALRANEQRAARRCAARGRMLDSVQQFRATQPAGRLLRNRHHHSLSELLASTSLRRVGASNVVFPSIIELWDQSNGPLLITGEVGSGKSTLLDVLARELGARTDRYGSEPVPTIMTASVLARRRNESGAPLEPSVLGIADDIPIFLLVDAFDELPNHLLDAGERCIRELSSQPWVARILVASRPTATFGLESFRRYALMPWTDADKRTFAARWDEGAQRIIQSIPGGNPLMVTLACAYAPQLRTGSRLELMKLVARDLLERWQTFRERVPSQPARDELEACCAWLLLGDDLDVELERHRCHGSARYSAVLDFLIEDGLLAADNGVDTIGTRFVIEYLAAHHCLHYHDPIDIAHANAWQEIMPLQLALELEHNPAPAIARLRELFALPTGPLAEPMALRAALSAAKACALHGPSLPAELVEPAINCLWAYVTNEASHWLPDVAADVLGILCDANPEVARLVRNRVEAALTWNGPDMTEEQAVLYGIHHCRPEVRAAAIRSHHDDDPDHLASSLRTWMQDIRGMGRHDPSLAAALRFRALERTPELRSHIDQLVELASSLEAYHPFVGRVAAALRPGEAPLATHAAGLQMLAGSGQCPRDVAAEFLAYPGGAEAAEQAPPVLSFNGAPRRLTDERTEIDWPSPIPRHSHFVQRACWRLLPFVMRGADSMPPALMEKILSGNDIIVCSTLLSMDRSVLSDALGSIRPWSFILIGEDVDRLSDLMQDRGIRAAFIAYLHRCADAHHGTVIAPPLRALEPWLVDDEDARRVFEVCLPQVCHAHNYPYRIPRALVNGRIGEVLRAVVASAFEQIHRTENPVYAPAIATTLSNLGWVAWEEPAVVSLRLSEWLEHSDTSFGSLVGFLLPEVPGEVMESILPALVHHLELRGCHDYPSLMLMRGFMMAMPNIPRRTLEMQPFIEMARTRMHQRGDDALAAAVALCQLVSPEQAGQISAEAASLQRERTAPITHEEVDQHFRVLVPLAFNAWRDVAMRNLYVHTFQVLRALFEVAPRTVRSQMSAQVWEMLAHRIPCHVTIDRGDLMLGRSMVDIATEWVFRHADFRTPAGARR